MAYALMQSDRFRVHAQPARMKMSLCKQLLLERRGNPLPYDDRVATSLSRENILADFSQTLQSQPKILPPTL